MFKLVFIYLLFAMQCQALISQDTPHNLNKINWILGTWENKTSKGIVYEKWTQQNESMYSGVSFKFKEKDTLVLERITILEENNQLYYIPQVMDQNDGKAIRFALKEWQDNELVFANPNHDFPQFIRYALIKKDSLVATVYGSSGGEEKTIVFPMRRKKR